LLRWTTSTSSTGAAASCSSTATIRRRSCRSVAPAISSTDKASIREALGRALFHAQRYEGAAAEFQAIASTAPTNDYALFCLGRAMQQLGRHHEACKPLALACSLRPSARTTGSTATGRGATPNEPDCTTQKTA